MGLLDAVRKNLGKPSPVHRPASDSAQPPAQPAQARQEPAPIIVPEIQPLDLIPKYSDGTGPFLLDCREPVEWRQLRIPNSRHIPMNQIPTRLEELDRDAEIVVVCAHGNRAYAVAGFLSHTGFKASSLAGGVTEWWMKGGETESEVR